MFPNHEAGRKAFHRHQMGALPTLLPGLDPDPPVLLCTQTQKYDETILAQLRRQGWPGTTRNKPPTPVKGAALARKIARGSLLTQVEIDLIGDRTKWLQRNPFRWNARDGYTALPTANSAPNPSPSPAPPATPATAGQLSQHNHGAPGGRPNHHAISAMEISDVGTSRPMQSDAVAGSSASEALAYPQPNSASEVGDSDPIRTPSIAAENHVSDLFDTQAREAVLGRSNEALASLSRLPHNDTGSCQSDLSAESEPTAAAQNSSPLIKLQCEWVKGIPSEKARNFLLAIHFCKPREKIERLARALVADEAQLSEALKSSPSARQDIIDGCAKLGVDLPC